MSDEIVGDAVGAVVVDVLDDVGVVSVVVGVVSVEVGLVSVVLDPLSVGGGDVSVVPEEEVVDVSVDELPVLVTARTAPKPPPAIRPATNRATRAMLAHDFFFGPPFFANGAIPLPLGLRRRRGGPGGRTGPNWRTSGCLVHQCHVPSPLPNAAELLQYRFRSCFDGESQ